MTVSLIVTTYNKEKYVKRCLESIANQNYDFLQVIIIDDGSYDGTVDICNEFTEKFNNFEMHSQKNMGVSNARNNGIRYAQGEYIMFVDGDDYLSLNYISGLMTKFNSDLLQSEYSIIKKSNQYIYHLSEKKIFGLNNIESAIFDKDIFPFISVTWAKIFKTSIIKDNNLKFKNQSYGEDTIFIMEYLNYVDSIQFENINGYNNVIIEGTLSRKRVKHLWSKLQNILLAANATFKNEYSQEWLFLYIRHIKLMLLNSTMTFVEFKESCGIIRKDADFKKIKINLIKSNKEKLLIGLLKLDVTIILYWMVKSIS